MTAWDAYTSGGATGDPDWMNITMPQTKDPFQKAFWVRTIWVPTLCTTSCTKQ